MKSFIVFALIIAAAVAAPAGPDADAYIVKSENDNIGVGGYSTAYETSNGIKQQERATLENVGTENEALSVQGEFSYTGPDNVIYRTVYLADQNGFRAEGAHIPRV